jgi:hypothetical protein
MRMLFLISKLEGFVVSWGILFVVLDQWGQPLLGISYASISFLFDAFELCRCWANGEIICEVHV